MSKSFDEVMSSKKNGRRRVSELLCFSPTLADEYQELGAEYVAALRRAADVAGPPSPSEAEPGEGHVAAPRRLHQLPEPERITREMAALVTDNPDAFYEVTFEALRSSEWRALRAAHPPRDKSLNDGGLYNADTFPAPAVAACMINPEPTPERMAFFDEVLADGEWERMARAVWNLNEGVRSVPKAETILSILGGSSTV